MTEGAHTSAHDSHSYRGPWDPDRHGTLAEEAVRLAEAAQTWLGARGARRAPSAGFGAAGSAAADAWAAAADPVDPVDQPAECRTCPICRARRFARSLDPEVLGHLSDAAGSLGAAVAALSRNRRSR